MVKRRAASILATVALITAAAASAQGTVIGFDDATYAPRLDLAPGSYEGLTWTNAAIYRQDYLASYGLPSGLEHGVVSPSYAMANLKEGYLIAASPTSFDFHGAAFTSLGKNNAKIIVEGYRPGDPLGSVSQAGIPTFSSTAMFSAGTPTDLAVDFTGIVALKVLASRWDNVGTTTNAYPAYGTYGDFFVMDNMVISVPEPSSLALALGGAAAVVLLGNFRRSCRGQ